MKQINPQVKSEIWYKVWGPSFHSNKDHPARDIVWGNIGNQIALEVRLIK